ncbi:MAG: SprT-like family protein [Pelotomaculum sp. PtaB.Bin104]|nr:MAG: SprT-like family protein [Pelotomaculum sp. PtaB.Bin104]
MPNLFEITRSPGEILARRTYVFDRLIMASPYISSDAITSISTADVQLMFELYDEIFFDHRIKQAFPGQMKFSLSRRLTKSAAKTFYTRATGGIMAAEKTIEIRMGVDFFIKYDEIETTKAVCGITTTCPLEAFLLVFEHELCHALEFIHFESSNCRGRRFKMIAKKIFGHTESYHELPTPREIAQAKYGLNIGDQVTFKYIGKRVEGILYNINKRATVIVRDRNGAFTDCQGNRYVKYYVPLDSLE